MAASRRNGCRCRGGRTRGLGAGGPQRSGAAERALHGVREGALWAERQGGVRFRRRSRFDEPLLRRLRDGVAASAYDGCAAGGSRCRGEAARDDEAQEREVAGDLQRSSALLLRGRQGRQGDVPAREHARRSLADHQAQRAAEHGQRQDAHVTRASASRAMSHQPLGNPSDESSSPRRQASDVELLRAIAGGSEPAFEELRARYGRAVERVCRAVAGSEREDCEQEVFARVWGKAALFDPARGSAAAWLLTVARRTALNQSAARRPPTPVGQEPLADAAEPNDVDAFWLETALQRLSEQERTVIELAYYG